MNKELIFLSTPYSHPDYQIKHQRVDDTIKYIAHLLNQKIFVYSPLITGLSIATAHHLPDDWQFWNEYCEIFIQRCDKVHVLMLKGWKNSTGVDEEIKLAKQYNKPIIYIDEAYNIVPQVEELMDETLKKITKNLISYKKKRKEVIGLMTCVIKDYLNTLLKHPINPNNYLYHYHNVQVTIIGLTRLKISIEYNEDFYDILTFVKTYRIGVTNKKEMNNCLFNCMENAIFKSK